MYGCRMRNVGVSAMYQMLRLTIAAMAVAFASFPTSAPAQVAATQIKLTEKHAEAVAVNISMVMAAIDPQTKVFTDPQTEIKKEIEDVSADKTIPDSEKKRLLEELNEALKSAQSIQFPTNI